MKKLIFISGAMSIGKTTIAKMLVNRLEKSVMLDGDWCWEQGDNWNYCQENKDMAVDNICYLLNSFLKNNNFNNVIFSWVLHLQETRDFILEKLRNKEFRFYDISLIANEQTIRDRQKVRNPNIGVNELEQAVTNSMDKMKYYHRLKTIKIDVSNLNKNEVLSAVLEIIMNRL
ncbi:MAG: AAA family ATPase [Endomicrobium sp.]|jgi:broad-specificity NMP kinase|nr:AAA family ATPase [Endomicrobium sp.]